MARQITHDTAVDLSRVRGPHFEVNGSTRVRGKSGGTDGDVVGHCEEAAVDEFVGRGVGGRERLDGLGRRQRGDSAYNDCHPSSTGRGSGLLRASDD